MATYRLIEERIQKKINDYKDKYFVIDSSDILDEKIDEAYNELLDIRDYIKKRLNIDMPILMSKIYINNREKIREENDQYRKEIVARTQCLKENNTVFIDPNYDIDVLGFNKVPYLHFKFIKLIYRIL